MACGRYVLQVHVGAFSTLYEALSIEASKETSALEIVSCVVDKLQLDQPHNYELAEVIGDSNGQDCKERRIGPHEYPAALQLLWPRHVTVPNSKTGQVFQAPQYRFCLRDKQGETANKGQPWPENADPQLIRDYFLRFLYQPREKEYTDLCQLPDLTEQTLLENLKSRFEKGHIYTYVGSILIAVNPFRFYPIYNPKYVKLYQNRRLGELPPHIFAIADAAYQAMLREKKNQCIVISGESGSGKTESTNLLLHHLTALSHKGAHGSGVEQTILSAGPVLEAFGNAKTKHNNNSSRFGKFIQVNYKENGVVHGAIVQNYLLEKSRIVCQARNERNYHVFYYLLAGASETEQIQLHLSKPEAYYYLNQSQCYVLDGVDEVYEYSRLKQSMEMVGFSTDKQMKLLSILSAVLHLGNVEFSKKSTHHSDEAVTVKNPDVVSLISNLLGVKEETLSTALTCKRAKARGETLVINYKMPEAVATRDALAKGLYGALFDWIVTQVNRALLFKRDSKEHKGNSIGVLDIFGFEDFGDHNSFEQFCINIANERLHYYFNQHVFKYEQEEYQREGIQWKNVEFIDNTACLELIEGRPYGLLCLLDDQCSFPGASNATLLHKFEQHQKANDYYEMPHKRENAFLVKHYAGIVKYQIKDFREKNVDLMRPDVVALLKSSSLALVRELVGGDPVALFRWATLRAFFRAFQVFVKIGKNHKIAEGKKESSRKLPQRRKSSENVSCKMCKVSCARCIQNRKPLSSVQGKGKHQASKMNYVVGCGHCCPIHNNILNDGDARVMERANEILLKRKPSKPPKNKKIIKELQFVKTMIGRTYSAPQRATRKQPSTVSAQFQASLNQLMEALNHANPFFVRCIKSNSEKVPNFFDEKIVLQQLRYTGMLETVRIRQSGYSVRLTFEEFIQQYRILLPKGLLSSQVDICHFLTKMNLNLNNYQMGKSKVFLRECEKLRLDEFLHKTIMQHIVTLQRWSRAWLARRHYKKMKEAVTVIQHRVRIFLQKRREDRKMSPDTAAICIQSHWKGYQTRKWMEKLKSSCVNFQSCCRGYLSRQRFQAMWVRYRREKVTTLQQEQTLKHFQDLLHGKGFLAGTTFPRDFAANNHSEDDLSYRDRESGICDDSEIESLPSEPGSLSMSPALSPLIKPAGKATKFVYHRQASSGSIKDIPKMEGVGDFGLRDVSYMKEKKIMRGKSRKHFTPFITGKKDKTGSLIVDDSEDSAAEEGLLSTSGENGYEERSLSSLRDSVLGDCHSLPFESSHHKLKSISKFHKSELCAVCEKNMVLFTQGFKCSGCKLLFHAKCAEVSHRLPCQNINLNRNQRGNNSSNGGGGGNSVKSRKRDKAANADVQIKPSTWNLTRTTEFRDPKDIIITDVAELQKMDEFMGRKIYQISHTSKNKRKKDSLPDYVFQRAVQDFKTTLISTYSVAAQDGQLCLYYKDLIDHFEVVMHSVCRQEKTSQAFPFTMGINAFRGFLDEFRNQYRSHEKPHKPKVKNKKRKRKKQEQFVEFNGHKFTAIVVNIPTACELCSSFMWMMEKSLVCQGCKLTCHRKCYNKAITICKDSLRNAGHRVLFGAPLEKLVNEESRIPAVIEKLITAIELRGLYTEGIYRKSGIASKVKELKLLLEESPATVDLDAYAVHVLTTVFKSFFREMPEPLMTFEMYDDFLRISEISDYQERLQSVYSHINKLPRANYDLLERLVFHLARVAQREKSNRMSTSGLAIIFAPCILRTNKELQAQDSLNNIARQTICLETLLADKLRHIQNTLADIDILDTACLTASCRLNSLKSSKVCLVQEENGNLPVTNELVEAEEDLLSHHINSLQNEKAHLTTMLPALRLTHSGSDEDLLGTDRDSGGGSVDNIFQSHVDFSLSFDGPVCAPIELKHLTKNRVLVPKRRLPSRFVKNGNHFTDAVSARNRKQNDDNSVVSLYQLNGGKDQAIIV